MDPIGQNWTLLLYMSAGHKVERNLFDNLHVHSSEGSIGTRSRKIFCPTNQHLASRFLHQKFISTNQHAGFSKTETRPITIDKDVCA